MPKLLILAFLALSALQAPPPQNDNGVGSIEGKVVLAGTPDPLSGVQVVLLPVRPVPDSKSQPPSATSDQDGHFLIANIPPGEYTVRAAADGFLRSTTDITPRSVSVSIEPRQEIKDFNIVMTPQSFVGGHVVDPYGSPVADALVDVQTPEGRTMTSTRTDTKGDFKVVIVPGQWIISAQTQFTIPNGTAPPPNNPERQAYARTYYPGVIDARSALRLEIREGDTAPSLDFRLQELTLFRVSGSVMADPSTSTALITGTVFLDSNGAERTGRSNRTLQVAVNSNPAIGYPRFEFQNVQPGTYTIYAVTDVDDRTRRLGRVSIDVGSQDVSNVIVATHSGVDVTGRIVMNISNGPNDPIVVPVLGNDESSFPSSVRSALGFGGVDFNASGEFTITNVPEGRYVVQAVGMPKDAALIEVREGGRRLDDHVLTITNRSPGSLQLTVGRGGTIQGNVLDADRKPVAGSVVLLLPERSQRRSGMNFETTHADLNGNFQLNTVVPGDYTILAFEERSAPDVNAPGVIDRYESQGTPVSVSSGASVIAPVLIIH